MSDGFSREPVFLTELGCNYRNIFEHVLIRHGVYPTQNLEFNSIEAIKQCVMAGMGVAILPRVAVEAELQQGRLVSLCWFEPEMAIRSQIVYREQQSPTLQAFLSIVRALLKPMDVHGERPQAESMAL